MFKNKTDQIEGMFRIIERRDARGLMHWANELERRKIPAVISVGEYMIDTNHSLIRDLANRGFEIAGMYQEGPFWNESHGFQYEQMSLIKDKLELAISKPMRVFESKYSAYTEDTLKIADKLGTEYIFGRGVAGAKAVVYKPEEYNVKILSVSNVPSKKMGTGSLCDASLWSRGATPDDFTEILFGLKADRIILVAHTNLSGVKSRWWNVYQGFFDANIVTWKSVDEFAVNPIVLPNAQIPINTELKYATPKPNIPLEQEPDYPFE